jgi:hypothetical protein
MKTKSAYERFLKMTPEQRAAETAQFDGDFDDSGFQQLDAASKKTWQRVKRKRGRPMVGKCVTTISVSVEKGLLSKADKLAKRLGISRAKLVANGLMHVLQETKSPKAKKAVAAKRLTAPRRQTQLKDA